VGLTFVVLILSLGRRPSRNPARLDLSKPVFRPRQLTYTSRMSYTIDERNPERQQLLAQVLEAPTRTVLARLPRIPGARAVDLGCGQGNTTRCLAEALDAAECVGVEYDRALVDYAQTRPDNPASVRFQQGDAAQLPFPDASFDVAFCRYLLIHIADPLRVVREMMRVVRPGGFVVAYEGDFSAVGTSHPPCAALETIHRVWRGLFQNPPAGRQLVHYFRDAGARDIRAGAWTELEQDSRTIRRIYRLSAEATGPAAASKGILTSSEVDEMIAGLIELEEDDASVLLKFPDIWVIAQR
jgi:ubiquinone/menaquinone biosynthesis C-methylase UbiE